MTSQLAQGLSAFWNDAHRFHNRTTVVVMSEFGRRLRARNFVIATGSRAGLPVSVLSSLAAPAAPLRDDGELLGERAGHTAVSLLSLAVGVAYGAWNVWAHGKIPMGAALAVQLAVVVFLFGLISEQIASGQERR